MHMKKVIAAVVLAFGLVAGVEAAPTDAVTQADLKSLLDRLAALEAQNKAQAARISELEAGAKATEKKVRQTEAQVAAVARAPQTAVAMDEGTTTNGTGRIYTTDKGFKYYLADKAAGIFEPLTESGLKFQPYGWLVLEGVYNTAGTDYPMYTDYVRPRHADNHGGKDHTATLSVNDSILGFNVFTPEAYYGWKFSGKFEFDLAGADANHTDFHVRHLFWNMEHEESGWSILFGQTWHLWKMVKPSEIDGAWLENTGYPYRRSPQIRVTKKWKWDDSSLEARVGLVKNGPGMGGDRDHNGTQDNEQSAWCLFEGALVYDHDAAWDRGRRWLVGIGGQYGRDSSRRFDEAKGTWDGHNDSYNSDMVMLAGSIPFSIEDVGEFTLCGQIFAGENLGGVQAGVGQNVAFRDPTRKGREVATVGGFIDLNYKLNDTWSFAAGYGFDNPSVRRSDVAIDTHGDFAGITYNDRSYVDAFYQWNDNLHFGLEYAYLRTQYVDSDEDNSSHRFQFTVYYDF